jgi:hypothetical protein
VYLALVVLFQMAVVGVIPVTDIAVEEPVELRLNSPRLGLGPGPPSRGLWGCG